MTQATAPDPRLAAARRTRLIVMSIYYVALLVFVGWLWRSHVHLTRWADDAALMVAAICVLAAGRLIFESFDMRLLGERLQVEGEGTPREGAKVRLQAAVIFLMGIVLVLPNVAFGFDWPPAVVYGAIVAFVVFRTAYTWRVLRTADEFIRRRMFEAAWWTLQLTTTALLLYGGAERLGLIRVATSWDVLVVMLGVAIVTPSFLFKKPKAA